VIVAAAAALAGRCRWAYLQTMALPFSPQQEIVQDIVPVPPSSGGTRSAVAWGIAGLGVMAVLGAMALWFQYGTAVFFEMISSGISSCF
jgi:hypothetical protein